MKIGYFRVSKEDETEQDIDRQIEVVKDKFNLGADFVVFKERGSAYDLDKIHKRKEFFRMLEVMFASSLVTINELFSKQVLVPADEIELYVWDYSRIIRNFELNLLFGILCDFYNVKIFSYKQGLIQKKENEKPAETLGRYILYSINAFSAEEYSWNISENVKKSVKMEQNLTFSSDGNKWGAQFRGTSDNVRANAKGHVKLSPQEIRGLNTKILNLVKVFEGSGEKGFYDKIISSIAKDKGILISKAYITKIRGKK